MKRALRWQGITALAMLVAVSAAGDMVQFSSQSSDSTPAEYLDARVIYNYNDGTGLLSLEIFNDTASPWPYTVSVLSFNVSDDVGNLTVQDNAGYALSLSEPAGGQGGFGKFDWSLDLGSGNDGILAGQSAVFTLDVTPAPLATVTTADFFSHPAIKGQQETGEAIIHFTRGPNDDSAWGLAGPPQIVPEPASLMLLGLGIAGMATLRRVRHGGS